MSFTWTADEKRLCGLLVRGTAITEDCRAAVIRVAQRHGLGALLAYRLREAGRSLQWSTGLRDELVAAERASVMLDAVRRPELARVVDALAGEGVPSVMFKGCALAETVYPEPHLRPRLDTDLLVREADLPMVRSTLGRLGYEAALETTGTLVTAQCHGTRVDRSGVRHALDVHWRPFNLARFANVLTFDEVQAAARPVPAVSPHALVPAPEHQLLLACVHRVAHHAEAPELRWLYDIHLLSRSFEPDAFVGVLDLAARKRVLAICLASLRDAQDCFATPVPPGICEPALLVDTVAEREGLTAYLGGPRPLATQLWLDLRALNGWRARCRLLREHLLPPSAYVRSRYGVGRLALPFVYAYRACCGAPRWFRR